VALIEALLDGGATGLTVVSNNAGNGDHGLAALIRERRVRKMVCSFPRQSDSWHFDAAYRAGGMPCQQRWCAAADARPSWAPHPGQG
jgi:3-oxoadipate CoA-transferase, alpha subunit